MRCAARAQRLRCTGERQANRTMGGATRQSAGSCAPTATAIARRNVLCSLGQLADHAWCVEARAHPSVLHSLSNPRVQSHYGWRRYPAWRIGNGKRDERHQPLRPAVRCHVERRSWRIAMARGVGAVQRGCLCPASTGGRALIRSTVIGTVPTVGGMLPLASGPGRRQFLQARAD